MNAPTVVDLIRNFNEGRDPDLVPRKYAIMAQNEFSFYRGTCHLFYRDPSAFAELGNSPRAWLCGDLHVENFGSYKGDNRVTYFDLNDFDEAMLAHALFETVRFLASILVGGQCWGLTEEESETLVTRALDAYVAELRSGKARWLEAETATARVRRLLDQVRGRTRTELLDRYSRVKSRRRRLVVDGEHVLPITPDERAAAEQIVETIAAASPDPAFFSVIDVARRLAGTGSIGVKRYVVLIEGHGSPDRNALIDVKQALPSSARRATSIAQPPWDDDAARVCAVQHRAQAVSPALLRSVVSGGDSFVVHELQPIADRMQLDAWCRKPRKLLAALEALARLTAWSQLRTASWRGASTADEWESFAARDAWHAAVLAGARDGAARNATDYAEFKSAYDAGAFGTHAS